ncbi:MAG: PAS domain S-box protein [Alphaproteobacteria bacterium]
MSLIDISECKLAEGALRASEERYRELFDESPVPIWDEDWTQIKQMFDDLAESGVTDWRGYFKDHRDQLKAAYDLAEVNEISLAACTLYRASSKEELEQTTTAALAIDEELNAFCEIALAFLAGEMTVEVEAKDRAVDGSYIFVRRRVVIPPNYRHDWSRVLYAIEDITEHTRSQAALAESEASLAEAQEIANSGSWVESHVGEQQITERWSAQLCRIFGIERDAAPQGFDAYLNYVHAEGRERVARTRSSAIEIGEHYEMEYRIVRPDGEVRSILSKSRPFKDETRNVRRIAGSITDVTERRRLEEAARERDERYQALFDNAGIGIALSNAEGQILESNPAVQNMFGYTARELKSLTIAELTHPDDVEESKKLRGAMVAGDSQTYQMDKRYVGKDERTIWGRVTSRPVHNSAGEFRFSAAMIEDISERNAADEALAESELQLQMITDNLPAFVAYVDANGYYRFANKFYGDWFRRPTDELIGSHIEDVIGSGNFADISESFHKVLRGEQIASIGNIRSHDGRNGHFFANYVPDHGPDGTVRGYYVLPQDITEMRRVEDELRHSEDCLNLAQRIAHIGNFKHHFVAGHYFDDELNWSDETCRIFGLDPERDTATPELLNSLIHPDDKEQTIAAYDKAMAGEGKYSCDYRLLLANGKIRHAH